eukprot:symbB.v1.2.009545.t2/scaffold604.1/size182248/3
MALDSEVFQCPKTMKAAGVRGQSVRVLARLRPFLDNEEEPTDLPCLRTVGSSQLEVLLEPRALLTDTAYRSRGRRRTIGGLHDIGSCKSAGSMPSVCSRGSIESPFLAGRGLESRTFSFDQVFDANASDDQVFSEIQDELQAALEGEAGSARCCVHSCIWCHWQWKDSYGHQHRREGGAKTQQRGRTIGKGGLSLGGLGSDCGNLQRALSGPADSSRCVSQCS